MLFDNQPAEAGDLHWVGQTCSIWMIAPSYSGVAGLSASSTRRTH